MMRIKQIIFMLFVFLITANVYAQYESVEVFSEFYTDITLCSYKNNSYVLIVNGYEDLQQYLVIYPDENYSARQVYGEILLKYYCVKNSKKVIKLTEGEWYYNYCDNSDEEVLFLKFLTDEFIILDYGVFLLDDNTSKDEKIQFYDIVENNYREETIGSSAGVLMGIKATDFLLMLKSYDNGK